MTNLADLIERLDTTGVKLSLHLKVTGPQSALTPDPQADPAAVKPLLLLRLAVAGLPSPPPAYAYSWVEWARALPVDRWQVWRDRAVAIETKLPGCGSIEAIEESMRRAWEELTHATT